MKRPLDNMNLPPSEQHHPDFSDESCPSTSEEAANAEASGAPSDPYAILARYVRIYDRARSEGASVDEAMKLVEAELRRVLEQRRRRVE
jgi:hypothetical protein